MSAGYGFISSEKDLQGERLGIAKEELGREVKRKGNSRGRVSGANGGVWAGAGEWVSGGRAGAGEAAAGARAGVGEGAA